jgi:hypothetical protein
MGWGLTRIVGHFPHLITLCFQGDRGETGSKGEQVRPPPFLLAQVAMASTYVQ